MIKWPWTPKPTLDEDAITAAENLEREILKQDLQLIDDQFKLNAQRAKQNHIIAWLNRDKPLPL